MKLVEKGMIGVESLGWNNKPLFIDDFKTCFRGPSGKQRKQSNILLKGRRARTSEVYKM